jgi:hypothetical protein
MALVLALALIGSSYVGSRAADRRRQQTNLEPLETMASGLLGLLLAFNFSIAQSRFDTRQELLVREANAIGTAYLRCSVLEEEARRICQDHFRGYAHDRVEAYEAYQAPEQAAIVRRSLANGEQRQNELWKLVADAVRRSPDPAHVSLMSALNSVIDADADRRASLRIQVPTVVSGAILLACFAWALLLGYSSGLTGRRSLPAWIVVSLLIAGVFGVALDFDRPRSGLITTSAAEQAMTNLVRTLDGPPVD